MIQGKLLLVAINEHISTHCKIDIFRSELYELYVPVYNGNSLDRPLHCAYGLSRRVVFGNRLIYMEMQGLCQKYCGFKTGGLSWQWSLKTGFTVYSIRRNCKIFKIVYNVLSCPLREVPLQLEGNYACYMYHCTLLSSIIRNCKYSR